MDPESLKESVSKMKITSRTNKQNNYVIKQLRFQQGRPIFSAGFWFQIVNFE